LTSVEGRYSHFARHAHSCLKCTVPSQSRKKNKKEKLELHHRKVELAEEEATQEPYASWSGDPTTFRSQTGVSPQVFDIVLRSTSQALYSIHKHEKHYKGHLLLTPSNMLLLYLVFLRKKPTQRDLALQFQIAVGNCFELVRRVAEVVAPVLEQYVHPNPRPSSLRSGELEGAGFITDTSATAIPRPGRGQAAERGLYYFFKHGGSWALKWQVTIGLDGTIWDHGGAGYPGSASDRQIFEESKLPKFIEQTGVQGLGDSHYARCEGMYGKKVGKKQGVLYAAYNEEIDSVRQVIENLNSRIKVWKALDFWDLDRHDFDFFTHCMGSVCGLLNLEIDNGYPIRKNLRTLKPSVAVPRLRAARKRRRALREEKERNKKAKPDNGEVEEVGKDGDAEGDEEEPLETEEWQEIDHIVRSRKDKDYGLMYLVQWLNGTRHWLTPEHITEEAVHDFEESRKKHG
jgi:hypothetical protein